MKKEPNWMKDPLLRAWWVWVNSKGGNNHE